MLSASMYCRMPSLIPLMILKDPPQIVFCLLQNLTLLMDRSTPDIQRDHVLPILVRLVLQFVTLRADI